MYRAGGKKVETKNLYMVRIKTVREKKIQYCGECVTSSEKACDIVRPIIGDSDKEVVITMCLDAKLKPLTIERTAIGTTDQCMVLPKEILKTAILSNARGIMIFHNHPSGNIEPSQDDKDVTARLQKAGQILGIKLLDHLVFTDERYYSFLEYGLM